MLPGPSWKSWNRWHRKWGWLWWWHSVESIGHAQSLCRGSGTVVGNVAVQAAEKL